MENTKINNEHYITELQEEAHLKPFEIQPLSPEKQQSAGWSVEINGEKVEAISEATVIQERMGIEIRYGQRPEGYDGIAIRELSGGGAVTIPYMIHPDTGKVYVGLVKENRPLLGGEVWNVPRGFVDMGETHEQAAEREVVEEMGYEASTAGRIIKLAEGLNPNSTYFDTSHEKEDGSPEGVSIFGMPLHHDDLEKITDELRRDVYVFPQSTRERVDGDRDAERIFGSMFVPIQQAMASRDMFTSAAAGQLLARMMS